MASISDTCGGGGSVDATLTVSLTRVAGAGGAAGAALSAGAGTLSGSAQTVVGADAGVGATVGGVLGGDQGRVGCQRLGGRRRNSPARGRQAGRCWWGRWPKGRR